MRKWLVVLAGVAALTSLTATPSLAQIGIDVPGAGVRIGPPHPHPPPHWRDYDGPRVYHEPRFRDREVYLQRRGCRTVTIHDDDGVVRRIRRCD